MSLRPVVKEIYDRTGWSGARPPLRNTKIMQMLRERDYTVGRGARSRDICA